MRGYTLALMDGVAELADAIKELGASLQRMALAFTSRTEAP